MIAKIVKIKPFTSYHGGLCYLVCFKDKDDKAYKTYIYPKMRNYKHWKPFLKKGIMLEGLELVRGKKNLINADSKIEEVK